jgi:hypothetical protein
LEGLVVIGELFDAFDVCFFGGGAAITVDRHRERR